MFLRKIAAPSGSYSVSKSLRFRSSASAYLNRTPASASNRKTWTWSGWVKLGNIGTVRQIFSSRPTASPYALFYIFSDNTIQFADNTLNTHTTSAVFRDPSAWYHIVLTIDTTQATATNRVRLWVNGNIQTWGTTTAPTLNSDGQINTATAHSVGSSMPFSSTEYFDGYLSEVNFIDGQALTPSSFGTYDANGVWQPIKYSGSFGTNGFYLNFGNTTSTTTLGYDTSGNSNNWTVNNVSLTAGSTYDSMTDSPTVSSATVANYAVLNPLMCGALSGPTNAGNLNTQGGSATWQSIQGTLAFSSGKFYYEATVLATDSTANIIVGAGTNQVGKAGLTGSFPGNNAYSWGVQFGGTTYKINNGTFTNIGTSYSFTTGDVLQVAVDVTNGNFWVGKNNTWLVSGNPSTGANPLFTNVTGAVTAQVALYDSNNQLACNFGQQPFAYTPPTGFNALNTYNLPTPTIANGAQYMAATTYTGTGATQTINDGGNNTIGTTFQPDLVWIKSRSAATNNNLFDVLRGTTAYLSSNSTSAEATNANTLTAFGSTGFTVGSDASSIGVNVNAATYVGWQWKANGTGVSNTNGSITSTVSANTTAGFSVVTYTGTGANATVGHGLGVAPSMIITKKRSSTSDWGVYHTSLTSAAYYLLLDTTAAQALGATYWNSTAPTSSVFSIGTADAVNISTATYVAYCWAAVSGYSAFGSYTGNGSADGPFVYANMRPRYVLIKRTDSTGDWYIWDTSRNTYNVVGEELLADTSGAGNTATDLDILSNGFKIRTTTAAINASSGTYVYAAFAENPFQNSRAR